MLKYTVKLSEPKGYDEIYVEDLYLSPDSSFISGVTNTESNLMDGQTIYIEFNDNNNFVEATVNAKTVTRKGYVIYEQLYHVEEYGEYYGVWFSDGRYYFCENSASTIVINSQSYTIDKKTMSIKVPTKYWVIDDKLTINGIEYNVDIELYRYGYKCDDCNSENCILERIDPCDDYDGNVCEYRYEINENDPPYVIIKGDVMLRIYECNQNDWHDVIQFIIKKDKDFVLTVDDMSCADKFPYVLDGVDKTVKCGDCTVIEKTRYNKLFPTFNANGENVINVNGKEYKLTGELITIDGDDYKVRYEWRNTLKGNHLHLFLDNSNYSFIPSQKIIVTSSDNLLTRIEEVDKYFIYCGKKYEMSKDTYDFAILEDKEYEITYTRNRWGIADEGSEQTYEISDKYSYIVVNNKPVPITVNGNNYAAPFHKFDGEVKKYNYIVIDGEKFIVETYKKDNDEKTEINYVDVYKKERYVLNIDEVISNSMIRCHPLIGTDGEIAGICNAIVNNYKLYNYSLYNPLFDDSNVDRDSFISKYLNNDSMDSVKLFNPSSYIELPISFGNSHQINVRRDDILENMFYKREKEKAINPIVDMEREIYYPCYKNNNGEMTLLNEIVFDLHFRSRNLNDWKINEDVYQSLYKSVRKDVKTRCDWNLFDYYYNYKEDYKYSKNDEKIEVKPRIMSNFDRDGGDDPRYYQPADLLYFLNFTDEDIFYQKSKVGKSFLRLLFFNNNDPKNQSLLYSCTVFMDEGAYYKKYTDNMLNKNQCYVNVIETDKKPIVSKSFNISSDTCNEIEDLIEYNKSKENDAEATFDEDIRISASFHIKNRYEMGESAEGFYLYIFKEYCEKLHEEPIYLKVEFNHAGEGRTINFMMPFKDEDMMDLSVGGADVEEFCKGIKLEDLYKYMYIPLESVYDYVNKRYCYYMPSWMCRNAKKESVMKFNLYEIKIKDESIDEK